MLQASDKINLQSLLIDWNIKNIRPAEDKATENKDFHTLEKINRIRAAIDLILDEVDNY